MRPQPQILIVGFGDIGNRVARLLTARAARFRITALIRRPEYAEAVRALGVIPVLGDLARPETLHKLAGNYACVFHFAPPPGEGTFDSHTRQLLAALDRHAARARMLSQPPRTPARRLVYISTTGVYGDCGGQWIDETQTPRPHNARAVRRVDAETTLRNWGRRTGVQVSILRAPGIYAADRLPLERLQKGTAALLPQDDVFTNHIHADDLARLSALASNYLKANRPELVTAVQTAFAGVVPMIELDSRARSDIFHFITAQLYDSRGRTANLKGASADAAINAVVALIDALGKDSAKLEAYIVQSGYTKSSSPAPRSTGF